MTSLTLTSSVTSQLIPSPLKTYKCGALGRVTSPFMRFLTGFESRQVITTWGAGCTRTCPPISPHYNHVIDEALIGIPSHSSKCSIVQRLNRRFESCRTNTSITFPHHAKPRRSEGLLRLVSVGSNPTFSKEKLPCRQGRYLSSISSVLMFMNKRGVRKGFFARGCVSERNVGRIDSRVSCAPFHLFLAYLI